MIYGSFTRWIERSLRRFLPRSLFGRSLLIVFVPLFVTQLVAFQLFYGNYLSLVSRRLADSVVADLATTVQMVARFPDQRDWILAQVKREQQLKITYKLPESRVITRQRNIWGPMDDDLQDAIQRVFKTTCHIDWHATADNVRIEMAYDDALLDIEVPRKRLATGPLWFFLAWAGGSAAVLFAIASIFLKNQVRAIRRISRSAERFGIGQDDGPIHPRGAREVRRAAVAFNRMRARINRFIEQRTTVLAGVSHDLRTPLTRMRLSLAMLPSTGRVAAVDLKPDIADMISDVAEMERLIDSYLTFARGEGAEQPIPTDLNLLVQRIAADVVRAGGAVRDVIAQEPVIANVRPDAMRRALTNLADNARKHGGSVLLTLERRHADVFIRFDDDGRGIAPALREEVFEIFTSKPADDAPKGSGLGLTIARDIVHAHGGEIRLQDSHLGGLRVEVRLPLGD